METKTTALLEPEEICEDATATLGRRINWTNTIKKWTLETPSFFPYFRSWYRGKDVAEAMTKYPLNNMAGLASNNREALQKTIAYMRERDPKYDPIAIIDPQSELLYFRSAAEADRKLAFEGGVFPKDISTLIANRLRTASGLRTDSYNDLLKLLYNPKTCAGWLDEQIRKNVAAGSKIGIPMLPMIESEESRGRWKEAYSGLKRLYLTTDNIEGEIGIPLALHTVVHPNIFDDGKEELPTNILADIEELKPTAVTVKVAFGADLTNQKNPERAQNTKNFLEAIGRTCKASNTPTHLFCENEDGIHAFALGFNTFSQPVDGKVLRTDFASEVQPSMEQRYGRIYDYTSKNRVTHKTWLTQSEGIGHAPCGLACCKDKKYGVLSRMTLHEFYHYAGVHLLVNRNQEVGEVILSIKESKLVQHLKTKYRR